MDLTLLISTCVPYVPPETLAALVAHESGGNRYAIQLNSRAYKLSRTPKTKPEAVAILNAVEGGEYGSYDVGLGQINSTHFERFRLRPQDLLDPCVNLRVSAQILAECYRRTSKARLAPQPRLAKALSCYNTGTFTRGFSNGYVETIYRMAHSAPQIDVALD